MLVIISYIYEATRSTTIMQEFRPVHKMKMRRPEPVALTHVPRYLAG